MRACRWPRCVCSPAVAARCSFSEAAEALHLSTAAVSMQVKTLEDYLQVQLLRRNTHRVRAHRRRRKARALCAARTRRTGAGLSHRARLAQWRRAGAERAQFIPHSWLTSRLPDLFGAHPQIDLRMQCTRAAHGLLALGRARGDTHGSRPLAAAARRKLFDEYLVPLCSPQLVARHGLLDGPGSLAGYPLLHSSTEPWEMWIEASVALIRHLNAGRNAAPPSMTALRSSGRRRMDRVWC